MSLPLALVNFAGLAACSPEQFEAIKDGLRRELNPTTVLEALLVEQAVLAVDRLRTAARNEPAGKIDKDWLRYQTTAERSFWKAYSTLEKMRRQAARVAKAEAKAAPQPVVQPQPEPTPIATTPPASRPTPPPASKSRAEPSRPNPKRPSFAELAAGLVGVPTRTVPAPPARPLAAAS